MAASDPREPGAELVAAAEAEKQENEAVERMAQASDPVVVFSAASVSEGQIIRALLDGEGIPAIFNDLSSPTLGEALSVTRDDAADVLVAPGDAERAKELIDSYRNATVTDDMVGEESTQPEE